MKSVWVLLSEPAGYTMDLVRYIYNPRGVDYAFIDGESAAAAKGVKGEKIVSEMHLGARLRFFWRQLRTHEVIILNGYTRRYCLECFLLNWLFFRRKVGWDSDTELRIPASGVRRVLKGIWLGWLFRQRNCFGLAGGNFAHRELFLHYGMDERRVVVMPMMVDNACYAREVSKTRSGRPFRFGYVGRLIGIKQVDKIILAFAKVRAMEVAVELHILGAGEERKTLERLAASTTGVYFHGPVFGEDKVALMQSLDCLVLYSCYEPWGLVVNEALAAGVPCIVSDRVGARRDLVEGAMPTGLVVPYDNLEALVFAMQNIVEDEVLWARCSRAAIERMAHWNYDYYGKQFDRFLEIAQ